MVSRRFALAVPLLLISLERGWSASGRTAERTFCDSLKEALSYASAGFTKIQGARVKGSRPESNLGWFTDYTLKDSRFCNITERRDYVCSFSLSSYIALAEQLRGCLDKREWFQPLGRVPTKNDPTVDVDLTWSQDKTGIEIRVWTPGGGYNVTNLSISPPPQIAERSNRD
jgi:hypothetical protein